MELINYNKIVREIEKGFKQNEKIFIDAFKTELQEYGEKIDIKGLQEILKNSDKVYQLKNKEGLEIAVRYLGDVSITLEFILLALKNNLKITFFSEGYEVFNTCIITILEEVLKELKIDNQYIKYGKEYDEKYLIDNQDKYDKIIFIGDYFEYKNLKYYISKEILYNNFGFIKGYINKANSKEEYQKIIKYCYINNIVVDFYVDMEEFLEEVSDKDKAVVFSTDEVELQEIKEKIITKDVLYNEFLYENYKFSINDIVKNI